MGKIDKIQTPPAITNPTIGEQVLGKDQLEILKRLPKGEGRESFASLTESVPQWMARHLEKEKKPELQTEGERASGRESPPALTETPPNWMVRRWEKENGEQKMMPSNS